MIDGQDVPAVLKKALEKAQEELGPEEVSKLSETMRALCLDLTDLDKRYYLSFDPDGTVGYPGEHKGLEPMLTIIATSETLHQMSTGETEPARAFALRKVKISGISLTRLRTGGNLIDIFFRCYREALTE